MAGCALTSSGYPMKVGGLPSACLGSALRWACKDRPVRYAETLMVVHQFSQIPVFDDDEVPLRSKLVGMATWQSLARARHAVHGSEPKLSEALAETSPQVVSKDADLFTAIPRILAAEAVLVQDGDDICGMVTAYDIADWLAARSEPFFALIEIETMLRDLVKRSERVAGRPDDDASIDGLSMYGCINKLKSEKTWGNLNTTHDREVVAEALDRARDARNHLMHGRDDAADDLSHCRNVLSLLRSLTSTGE